MGKATSVNINDTLLKKSSMKSMSRATNNLSVKERDYMIRSAMVRLRISPQWHDAVAKGACYLQGERFWELVDFAMKAKKPANYFVFCVNKELKTAGI